MSCFFAGGMNKVNPFVKTKSLKNKVVSSKDSVLVCNYSGGITKLA